VPIETVIAAEEDERARRVASLPTGTVVDALVLQQRALHRLIAAGTKTVRHIMDRELEQVWRVMCHVD
jgi:hypothetical protein